MHLVDMTLQTRPRGVCKHPIIALYFESENELKFYNLEASYFEIGKGTIDTTLKTQSSPISMTI